MYLNSLKPAAGAKKTAKRVGRGIGSGFGKTCGRGHKGQRSRSGGYHKVGFEGGQMPLQRRLPKVGFVSPKEKTSAQVCLHELQGIQQEIITLESLKAANIIPQQTKRAKVIASGKLTKLVKIQGLAVTKGARVMIESIGGTIET
ncbi:MAG: 50S ribosomal protein L15 [Thiotrichaceae bacterium]|nr:50S ribosomal protein L15 [Thiotrichaceae bacterium]